MCAQINACPACAVAPSAEELARMNEVTEARIMLSLPTIHCAACISTVERTLSGHAGVHSARVNLTLKRVSIEAAPDITAEDMIMALSRVGYEAHELDTGTLMATQTDNQDATRDLLHWISAIIALPAIVFSAQPFFKNAWSVLRVGHLNMDVPISLAILLASLMSLYEVAQGGEHAYFDAALSLTFFLLAGRYLDHRTRAIARSAAEELAALEVPRAERLIDGKGETVPIADLAVGDLVRVKPGGRMPVDGVVVEGNSELDRSLLTGETVPVFAGPESVVSAGEINLTGPLTLRVTAAGRDTSLHRLADLVATAESSKNRYTSLADKAAAIYAPGVHFLSFLAFLGWMTASGGDLRLSLNIAVAVLIITCPCALGLAVPAVTTAASGRMFRRGMLIKSATALERLAEVDTVVFDKTGTLTQGTPELTNLADFKPRDLQVALALAQGSSHPLAVSLTVSATEAGIKPASLTDLQEVPGYGVQAQMGSQTVRLGRASWVGGQASENTATYLKIGDGAVREFVFTDRLREGAAQLVAGLKAQGMALHLLSGDNPGAVERLAKRLGFDNWTAQALPQDKSDHIQTISENGARVLMVGDGLNDTAALAAAHVSISPATALDAARVASDIVLLGSDLQPVSEATQIAQKATRRIKENFAIAAGYNMIAIPIALMGFATPLMAALAMSTSSITVSLNALRLR